MIVISALLGILVAGVVGYVCWRAFRQRRHDSFVPPESDPLEQTETMQVPDPGRFHHNEASSFIHVHLREPNSPSVRRWMDEEY